MNKQNRALGCFFWSVPIALLTIAALYWSWCWGWWGQNRYLRYLLQCNCPAVSEEARYSTDVDVLISACEDPAYGGKVSPSGRYAVFASGRVIRQSYLYDQLTETTRPFPGNYVFLTDQYGLLLESDGTYFATIDGGPQRLLKHIDIAGQFLLEPATLTALKQAEKIYLIGTNIVAMASDFEHSSEPGYFIQWGGSVSVYPLYQEPTIVEVLNKNSVTYEKVILPKDSPLIIIEDKYLLGGEPPTPGVVRVPQPLLKKRLPLESYAPEARPGIEARWVQEETAKVQAAVVFWGVIGSALTIGLFIFWRQRRSDKKD